LQQLNSIIQLEIERREFDPRHSSPWLCGVVGA
jgi:hypothetical protein